MVRSCCCSGTQGNTIPNFLGDCTMKNHWQTYRELELIPDSVTNAEPTLAPLQKWLSYHWQAFYNSLTYQDVVDQPIEYLEECYQLDCETAAQPPSVWAQLWELLTRPIGKLRSPSHPSEPRIQQIQDREGHTWWQAYDPISGQMTYLSSEQEVQIWLEERLYF